MNQWNITITSDVHPYGWGEDEMIYCEVYFLIATNPQGRRLQGPILGNNIDNTQEEIQQKAEELWHIIEDWQPWFPVYGSDAYQNSGQEAANLYAERNNQPYFPV